LTYWQRIFEDHNLGKFTKLNTAVTSLEWSESEQHYRILLEDSVTGEHQETTAEVVISAVGFFQDPIIPSDISGTETFQGPSWHSARWRHDVNLAGKRVGVVGNGCSGLVTLLFWKFYAIHILYSAIDKLQCSVNTSDNSGSYCGSHQFRKKPSMVRA
jgi:hypothetical protein